MEKIVNLIAKKSVFFSSLDTLQQITIISLGGTSLSKGTQKEINLNTQNSITPTDYTKKILDTYFAYAKDSYINILELGAIGGGDDTLDKKVENLEAMLDNEELNAYYFLCPADFISNKKFTALLSKYNDVNNPVYFILPLSMSIDLASDSNIPLYKGYKSAIFVLEQTELDTFSSVGIFAGLYKQNFIINASNKMKSFDYLFVNQNIKSLNKTQIDLYKKYNIVYFGSLIGKPNIQNVKTQEGEELDYYISYDNLAIRVCDAITNKLVNANNLFNQALVFNNPSILTLKSVIEGVLDECKNLKLISEYGHDYDSTSKAILKQNEIAYVDFPTYLKQSQDEYKIGLYNGFSFDTRISRFILFVNIQTNLY